MTTPGSSYLPMISVSRLGHPASSGLDGAGAVVFDLALLREELLQFFRLGFRREQADDDERAERGEESRVDERDAPGVAVGGRDAGDLGQGEEAEADDRARDDRGQAAGLGHPLPGQRGDEGRGDGHAVDRVGEEAHLQDGLELGGQQEGHDADGDDEDLLQGDHLLRVGVLLQEALVDVAHERRRRREEVVHARRDDDGAGRAEQEHADGEGDQLFGRHQDDLAARLGHAQVDLALELAEGEDGDDDDDRLDEDRPDRPPGHGLLGVLARLGAVELLVHALHAQEQEHRRQEVADGLEPGMDAELAVDDGEIARLEGRLGRGQAARRRDDEGHGEQAGQDDDDAVRQVRVGDGDHAAQGREEDDESGGDERPGRLRDLAVGDDVEDEAAGDELVGDDGDEGHDEGDGPEEARRRAVADLEDVADRVLPEGVDLGGQEVDEDDPDPGARGQPEGREAGLRGELGAADEGPGPDPGADQGEDHDLPLEAPAGDHELLLALDPPRADEVQDRQGDEIGEDDDEVGRHAALLRPG